ncbi:PepSY domain-containing protein [Shewanella cyperi]|uniref:PepSY domain-containing protein n=1 Tax=Shewanella cyperi TaxID=2814292 RepID=A0A975ALM1_9GAMM|nr:PepSY-associated TM helix domain-containing protein [Shewanella cyperi]QSX30542.1 PepSY domain-containing protein [Shewanella cyperi]
MSKKLHSGKRSPLSLAFKRHLRPWHRRLGLVGALFLVLLALTGVAINHADDWHLPQSRVTLNWLLDWYGIQPPNQVLLFETAPDVLGATDNLLWLGEHQILEAKGLLLAAARTEGFILAIDSDNLYLLDGQGQLQEVQDTSTGLPKTLANLAVMGPDEIWLQAADGMYQSDSQLIEWTRAMPFKAPEWIQPVAQADTALQLQARSASLNWERVLLDLHSGRLFGPWAKWLWDFLAFVFVLISVSGGYIWWQQKRH